MSFFLHVPEKEPDMNATDAAAIARHLFETQGAKAIAEAAQKAVTCREAGDAEQERLWRRVEDVLREMRGPHQS
ncbi:MAG TPA: hypothetical protein VHG88_07255 [Burkholderiales bacterium]|nr:hypothetical protein [Burkholderiales bacterium]